ncbi:MAG: peptide deformylase [Spirochaetales bacterium]|nr:peptide deformylase [Spirochaetales bacterium]
MLQEEILIDRKPASIVRFGDPVLRERCKDVTVFHKGLHKKVDRIADTLHATTATVRYQDRRGEYHEITRKDDLARCFRHEIDHLDGILFIDRMSERHLYHESTHETIPVAVMLELTRPRRLH